MIHDQYFMSEIFIGIKSKARCQKIFRVVISFRIQMKDNYTV
jgi:hypothetical protein